MRKTCVQCHRPRVRAELYAFCSQRCAAKWAVFEIQDSSTEVGQIWCRLHGWQGALDGCYECESEPCRRCGHERMRHAAGHSNPEENGCHAGDYRFADCDCPSFVGPKRGDER